MSNKTNYASNMHTYIQEMETISVSLYVLDAYKLSFMSVLIFMILMGKDLILHWFHAIFDS